MKTARNENSMKTIGNLIALLISRLTISIVFQTQIIIWTQPYDDFVPSQRTRRSKQFKKHSTHQISHSHLQNLLLNTYIPFKVNGKRRKRDSVAVPTNSSNLLREYTEHQFSNNSII